MKSYHITATFVFMLAITACDNKMKPMFLHHSVGQPSVEQSVKDDFSAPIEEKNQSSKDSSSSPTGSYIPYSSHSEGADHYDNMRGFDPASENDMDDNGMSRYMDNYDDEGWD